MRICGIVAEYNPFHTGHLHHIRRAKECSGATHIAVILAGSFVQRAEPALLSKHARAEMAVHAGADVVFELPAPYAVAPAQRYAAAAVSLLDALGCVDVLSFGSECGSLPLLQEIVLAAEDPRFPALLREFLGKGMVFPRAREAAVCTLVGPRGAEASAPNDSLGIEYLQALRTLSSPIRPLAIPREGAGHGADTPADGFASASFLRSLIRAERCGDAAPYLPPFSSEILSREMRRGAILHTEEPLHWMALHRLRSLCTGELAALPDISEGLEYRIAEAASSARSLEEFFSAAKTKRYTLARLRRIAAAALLLLRSDEIPPEPPYLRILAMEKTTGPELLRRAKSSARIPILTSPAAACRLSEAAEFVAQKEAFSSDLRGLCVKSPERGGQDFRSSVTIVQKNA